MNGELTITDTLITPPTGQVLTLEYVKAHIRALGSTDDDLTLLRIDAAIQYFEEYTGRVLATQTHEAWLDGFPFIGANGKFARIELPNPPLLSVPSITYIDGDGVTQSFTDGASPETNLFTVSAPVGPYARRGFVEPIYGQVWPTARCQTGSVKIRYTCGYGTTPEAMPALVRSALCAIIAQIDTYPSATNERTVSDVPLSLKMMLDGFKYSALPSQLLRRYGTWIPSATSWWPR